MLAIAQDGVEHDVGHFRVAAGGGLLSKSQSMGGPIRDEASGGIGNNALKRVRLPSMFVVLLHLSFAKLKKMYVCNVTCFMDSVEHLKSSQPQATPCQCETESWLSASTWTEFVSFAVSPAMHRELLCASLYSCCLVGDALQP